MASSPNSSGHKINLRLPAAADLLKDRPSSQLPTSRTDNSGESVFTSEVQFESTPRLDHSCSFKSLQSITRLKETLTRTSLKLKTYSTPADLARPDLAQSDMLNEINKLRLEVKLIEKEK